MQLNETQNKLCILLIERNALLGLQKLHYLTCVETVKFVMKFDYKFSCSIQKSISCTENVIQTGEADLKQTITVILSNVD